MHEVNQISPGYSWYEATVGERPKYEPLDGDTSCDVVIIGGGFTGLSAAANLAEKGVNTVLIEAQRFGDGASGRNGGQLGTGQRAWCDELEPKLGVEHTKQLFQLAQDAKDHLLTFAKTNNIEIDYRPGQLSLAHKARFVKDYKAHADFMNERYDYPHLSFMDRDETSERLGSKRYHGGIRDTGTGHIHPLKLLVGTARVAATHGAKLHEKTPARGIQNVNGKVHVKTPTGTIIADKCLIATNAYGGDLESKMASHVMPIRSFIGATVQLPDELGILPGGESVDDSRYVVRYFRKTADNLLLFGGREAYTADEPGDISTHIRRQIAEIFPKLKDIEITHSWGGSVGITMERQPFVREVMPNVIAAGGYSGHGVMLSNYVGRLYGESITRNIDMLEPLKKLKITPFPGGRLFNKPILFLALTWHAMLDRF